MKIKQEQTVRKPSLTETMMGSKSNPTMKRRYVIQERKNEKTLVGKIKLQGY